MKAVLLVAQTGQGKTTYAKKILNQCRGKVLINDVNGEYGYPYKPVEAFMEDAIKATNTLIIFEEATIFFSQKGNSEQMREILVRKRHTNNFIVLIFHSLRSIPIYILELCNYMVLYKTNDTPVAVKRKYDGFDSIINGYERLKNAPDYSHIVINLV